MPRFFFVRRYDSDSPGPILTPVPPRRAKSLTTNRSSQRLPASRYLSPILGYPDSTEHHSTADVAAYASCEHDNPDILEYRCRHWLASQSNAGIYVSG